MSGNTVDDPEKTPARLLETMENDYTVLTGSHKELAEQLLPQLKEEMPEEEYEVDFTSDLRNEVIEAITRDLSTNVLMEDWYGMGFEEPEDFLDAEAVSETIAICAERYFKEDQIGKSFDVLRVILEYAEKHGLAENKP